VLALDGDILERPQDYVAQLAAGFGRITRRDWAGVYLHGLMLTGSASQGYQSRCRDKAGNLGNLTVATNERADLGGQLAERHTGKSRLDFRPTAKPRRAEARRSGLEKIAHTLVGLAGERAWEGVEPVHAARIDC